MSEDTPYTPQLTPEGLAHIIEVHQEVMNRWARERIKRRDQFLKDIGAEPWPDLRNESRQALPSGVETKDSSV